MLFALYLDAAAMLLDNAPDACQSKPAAVQRSGYVTAAL